MIRPRQFYALVVWPWFDDYDWVCGLWSVACEKRIGKVARLNLGLNRATEIIQLPFAGVLCGAKPHEGADG